MKEIASSRSRAWISPKTGPKTSVWRCRFQGVVCQNSGPHKRTPVRTRPQMDCVHRRGPSRNLPENRLTDQNLDAIFALHGNPRPHLDASSRPLPTLRETAASAIHSVKLGPAPPTVIASEAPGSGACQPNALSATMRTVVSLSASGKITLGFLAPPWHWRAAYHWPSPAAKPSAPRRDRAYKAH